MKINIMTDTKSFGDLVREKRIEKNFTQEQLALALEIPRTSIASIEADNQRVYLDQAIKIANFLGISLHNLQEAIKRSFLLEQINHQPSAIRESLAEIISEKLK